MKETIYVDTFMLLRKQNWKGGGWGNIHRLEKGKRVLYIGWGRGSMIYINTCCMCWRVPIHRV